MIKIDHLRQRIINRCREIVEPRLRSCGYVDDTEPDNRLRIALWAPDTYKHQLDDDFETDGIEIVSPGFHIQGLIGMTKEGPLIGTVPCSCTQLYDDMPVEALQVLYRRLKHIKWEEPVCQNT